LQQQDPLAGLPACPLLLTGDPIAARSVSGSGGSPTSYRSMRHHHACSRAHQVGALLLVAATFLLTRLFDRLFLDASSPSSPSFPLSAARPASPSADLRIYVYSEDEIQGLRALLRGRDGTVAAATCLKGQWGTQVYLQPHLLLFLFHPSLPFVTEHRQMSCLRRHIGISIASSIIC